jgi:hypothetical protein
MIPYIASIFTQAYTLYSIKLVLLGVPDTRIFYPSCHSYAYRSVTYVVVDEGEYLYLTNCGLTIVLAEVPCYMSFPCVSAISPNGLTRLRGKQDNATPTFLHFFYIGGVASLLGPFPMLDSLYTLILPSRASMYDKIGDISL